MLPSSWIIARLRRWASILRPGELPPTRTKDASAPDPPDARKGIGLPAAESSEL